MTPTSALTSYSFDAGVHSGNVPSVGARGTVLVSYFFLSHFPVRLLHGATRWRLALSKQQLLRAASKFNINVPSGDRVSPHVPGVCHRDISLENILMDTRLPQRGSASRSCSVSSIGSCVSVASSAFGEVGEDSCGADTRGRGCAGSGFECDAGLSAERKALDAGVWVGRPRLCDFGMSVRIPRSRTTGKLRPLFGQQRYGVWTCRT